MLISSVVKGLSITFKKMFTKKVTIQYPDVMPKLPPRSRSSFVFDSEKCTSCGLCAMSCPNSVIKIESGKDEKGKKVLEHYRMSLGYCMFCGLCVEACPFDAINFSTDFEHAYYSKDKLLVCWEGLKKAEKQEDHESAGN